VKIWLSLAKPRFPIVFSLDLHFKCQSWVQFRALYFMLTTLLTKCCSKVKLVYQKLAVKCTIAIICIHISHAAKLNKNLQNNDAYFFLQMNLLTGLWQNFVARNQPKSAKYFEGSVHVQCACHDMVRRLMRAQRL